MTTRRFEWHRWADGVAAPPPPPASTSIPYGSSWRHLVIAEIDTVDRAAPAFDDTGWATSPAPFASSYTSNHVGAGWLPTGTTLASANTGIWLRRTIATEPGAPVTVRVRVDGRAVVYWNGAAVSTITDTDVDWPARSEAVVVVTASVLASNTLAVHAQDDAADGGADAFALDVSVEIGTPVEPTGATYADTMAATGPVGYWRLDELTGLPQDSSGNDAHATSGGIGIGAYDQPSLCVGDPGRAIRFASNTQFRVPVAAWMNPPSVTVSGLVDHPSNSGTHSVLTRRGTEAGSSNNVFALRIDNGKPQALIWTNPGGLRIVTAPTVATLGRHHIAATYNHTTGHTIVYLDGVAVVTHAGTPAPLVSNSSPLDLGRWGSGYEPMAGTLDELAFHDRALTTAEIQTLATAADTPPPDPEPEPEPEPEPVLVEGWVLDEDRSKALHDFAATTGGPEASVSLRLAAPLAPIAPDLGERFRITLTEAARAAYGITEADAPRFTGEVTDAVTDDDWHNVTGMGRWAKHGRWTLNLRGAPVEDDGNRIARVLAATRSADDVGQVDPGTAQLLAHPDPAPAAQLVAVVSDSTTGRLVEQRDGTLDWHDADHRRGAAVVITLTAAEVFGPGFTWAKRVGDLINDQTVSYGAGDKAVSVRDGHSVDVRGPYPASVSTLLRDESAAYELGALIVSRRADPAWQLPAVQVDLTRTVLDPARTAVLAGLRHGDRIKVTGLPPSPDAEQITEAELFVELVTEQAWRSPGTHDTPARDQWRLTLSVTDPARSGVALRWVDLPVGLSWTELAPGLSWLDLGRIENPDDPALTTP